MHYISGTDIGKMRKDNQDAYTFIEFDGTTVAAVVCDGMGGVSGGEIASKIAVTAIREYLLKNYKAEMTVEQVKELIEKSFTFSNEKICEYAETDAALQGMGTTAVLIFVIKNVAVIAHIGDSRAYLFDDSGITKLTKDHSLVQDMIDSGSITEEEAKVHPHRNVITRVLGMKEPLQIDIGSISFSNSSILLCTDGLTEYIDDEEIYEIVRNHPEICTKMLVDIANERGGDDNITVAVLFSD